MMQLALLPRDGLFLKDGRGWYTSDVGRSHGHAWPHPPTVRGALRAAYGHHIMARDGIRLKPVDWEHATADLRIDKLLAMRRPAGTHPFTRDHRVWPVPADALHLANGKVHRLLPNTAPRLPALDLNDDPNDLDGDADQARAFANLWRPDLPTRTKPGPRPDFWTEADMRAWLLHPGASADAPIHIPGLHLSRRTDLHVTIDPGSQTATPSMLFSSEVTEPLDRAQHEWALGIECTLPADTHTGTFPAGPVLLGGRRRLALVERDTAPEIFTAPAGSFDNIPAGRGLRLICVTPAAFTRGWLPDGFAPAGNTYLGTLPGVAGDVILRAALVPRPLDLSTWNTVAGCPRPTRRLVRPGAVYFFEKQDGPFTPAEHAALWLAALGDGRDDGLGLVVPGRWHIQGDQT